MLRDEVSLHYEAEWKRLLDLADQRNTLLKQLRAMADAAGEFHPEDGLLVEFNLDRAHSILAQLQELRPKIFSIIEALNRYAAQIGKPRIERRRLDV